MTEYHRALAALQERGRFGVRLGLGRTRALLRELGDPHLGLRGALVGGTNGKGSVQAIVAAIVRRAGYRVGQTPKPHLVSYRERMTIDGEPIAPEQFADLIHEVARCADRVARRLGPPTEFELLTAAEFAWFARSGVDVGVVEVGMGGRLDATNTWDGGVAAITNVDWDHMDRLGGTLAAIAREKAHIIKRGDRAVTGATGPGLDVIRRRARRMGVPLDEVTPLRVEAMDRGGLWLQDEWLGRVRLGLRGRHQALNAVVALGVVRALVDAGILRVADQAIVDGLAGARWPGRLELLALTGDGEARASSPADPDPAAPDILLDGAHNVAGVEALVAAIDELTPRLSHGRPTLLLALMRDKEVRSIVERLVRSPSLADAHVVTTSVVAERALPAEDLAAVWRAGRGADRNSVVVPLEPVAAALDRALDLTLRERGPLIVAGSLYLVGEVRARLLDDPSTRDPADQEPGSTVPPL